MNINWIKLKLDLLSEHRFIEECDDFDKLLFIGLLMLAGLTRNRIPNNAKYIKRMLNLHVDEPKISEKIAKLSALFRGLISNSQFIKFKNFNRLHNWYGSAEGTPKDLPDKNRIDKIRIEYIKIKGYSLQDFQKDDYARTGKAIKILLTKGRNNADLIIEALKWATKQGWCDWTLETIIRRWPDFLKLIFRKRPGDIIKKQIEEWSKEPRFEGSKT